MCGTCGCGKKGSRIVGKVGLIQYPSQVPQVGWPHGQQHSHQDQRHHQEETPAGAEPGEMATRLIEVEQKILARNDEQAAFNRGWLTARGVKALNFISSPGAGKTYLLEKTLEAFRGKLGCAVIVGDQESDNDARRLSGKGALVTQIETGHACHLEAEQVYRSFATVIREDTKLLLIENVGNLICPAAFNLGEEGKVVLLSVTEGEDKPIKYPVAFSGAQVIVLSKIDLAEATGWNRELTLANIKRVAPMAKVFELSARSGAGLPEWLAYLETWNPK